MNKEAIEKRLVELQAALDQTQANGNAIIGAMQECRHWLAELETAGETTEYSNPLARKITDMTNVVENVKNNDRR